MNTNFTHLTIELVVGFIALLVLTKLLGKTQINQLTPFDFISALVIGELLGNAIYDKEIGLNYVLYAVFLWGMLITTVEWITQKYKKSRSMLEGQPDIIIRQGIIDREQLKKNKLDINQLQNLLRNKGVFSLQEVEYALLEPNGMVNVLKKSNVQSVTKEDMGKRLAPVLLPVSIISDGEWIEDNILQTTFSKETITEVMLKNGIQVEHVLYGEWNSGSPLYFQINHSPFIKRLTI